MNLPTLTERGRVIHSFQGWAHHHHHPCLFQHLLPPWPLAPSPRFMSCGICMPQLGLGTAQSLACSQTARWRHSRAQQETSRGSCRSGVSSGSAVAGAVDVDTSSIEIDIRRPSGQRATEASGKASSYLHIGNSGTHVDGCARRSWRLAGGSSAPAPKTKEIKKTKK